MWQSFVVAFAVTAALGDVWLRKIPRPLTLLGFVAGLTYHAFFGRFWTALLTAALAFALGLGLYELRAIGGGDVKLVAAMGAILGFQPWVTAIEVAFLVAGLMALAGAIYRRVFVQTFHNIWLLLKHFVVNGLRPHPDIQVDNAKLVRIPFGVAVATGTIFAVVLR
jgi:prepilin peptidase CpaA